MKSREAQRDGRAERDAADNRLLEIQMIEQQQCIVREAGDRDPLGVADLGFAVASAFERDPAHSGKLREDLRWLPSVCTQAMLP
jgi:hypothetical protein